jgi:hypothetical protein
LRRQLPDAQGQKILIHICLFFKIVKANIGFRVQK